VAAIERRPLHAAIYCGVAILCTGLASTASLCGLAANDEGAEVALAIAGSNLRPLFKRVQITVSATEVDHPVDDQRRREDRSVPELLQRPDDRRFAPTRPE
jgi:hypothetical protein